jgi:hypothetical protein
MIILTKWEEKCLRFIAFIVTMIDVANETFNSVKYTK